MIKRNNFNYTCYDFYQKASVCPEATIAKFTIIAYASQS